MSEHSKHRTRSPQSIERTYRHHFRILMVVTFFAFASSLPGDYIWNDTRNLLDGAQRVQSLQDLSDLFLYTADQYRTRLDGPVTTAAEGSWQWITTLDFSLGWAIWRDCSLCFRVEGLLLHLITVIGFLHLGRHLLSQRRRGNGVALWAAMGFAVHPIVVPVVSSSEGRPVLLATAFAVWALVLFSRLPPTSKSVQHKSKHAYLWLGGIAAAAMGAWELAMLLPSAALLIAWFDTVERNRPGFQGISRIRRTGLLILLGVVAAYTLYRILVFGGPGLPGAYPTDHILNNLGTAVRLVMKELLVIVIPGEPVLSDAFRITRTWGSIEIAALLGILIWAGLTFFGLIRRYPPALGSAWVMLWLIPPVLLPTHHYYQEAALYPAHWGFMFGVAFVVMQLWRPIGRQLTRGSETVVFGPLIAAVAFITILSNVRFWDDRSLFESEVDKDPYYIEGRAVLTRLGRANGLAAEPLDQALKAIEASQDQKFTGYYPKFEVFRYLGDAQLALSLFEEAEASFSMALKFRPKSASSHHGMGRTLLGLGDHTGAIGHFQQAYEYKPDYLPAVVDSGIALVQQQRYREGLERLELGLQSGLDGDVRRIALADAHIGLGQFEAAMPHLQAALDIKEAADTRAKLAWVQWKLGSREKATENINTALQLDETSSAYVLDVYKLISEP